MAYTSPVPATAAAACSVTLPPRPPADGAPRGTGPQLGERRRIVAQELRDADRPQVAAMQERQKRAQRPDRLSAVLVHLDDRARTQPRRDVGHDLRVPGAQRVPRVDVPEDLEQPEAVGDPVGGGVVQLVGWPPEVYRPSRACADRARGDRQLVADRGGWQLGQRQVVLRVVADGAEAKLRPQVPGEPLDAAADVEERGPLMGPAQLAQRQVRVRPGAIVEREGDVMTVAAAAVDGHAEGDQPPHDIRRPAMSRPCRRRVA
jgi:hypothetical protein